MPRSGQDNIWKKGLELLKSDRKKKLEKLASTTSSGKFQHEKPYSGFTIDPSKLFIIDNCADKDHPLSSLSEIKLVYLPFYRIRTIGAIQDCRNLTICVLPNNYISFFHGLSCCRFLKRLDLHSNQIYELPGESFWKQLTHLVVLNLHDNHIDSFGEIEALSHCLNLLGLTLYDTPLSRQNKMLCDDYLCLVDFDSSKLKKQEKEQENLENRQILSESGFVLCRRIKMKQTSLLQLYPPVIRKATRGAMHMTDLDSFRSLRHIVVNALWCLKALDHYVIGDDEVIEEVTCTKRFQAQNPSLFVDLCPQKPKFSVISSTFKTEMGLLRRLISDVHVKQKHGSPVLVIQRWLRGYICRKRLNISYFQVREKLKMLSLIASHPPSPTRDKSVDLNSKDFTIEQFKMVLPIDLLVDFEQLQKDVYCAYVRNPTSDVIFHVLDNSALLAKPRVWKILQQDSKREAVESMSKILTPISSMTNNEVLNRKLMLDEMQHYYGILQKRIQLADKKRKELYSHGDYLVPNHSWRIDKNMGVSGEKHVLAQLDPMAQMIARSKLCGIDVRDSIQYWHELKQMQVKPKRIKSKFPKKPKDAFPIHLFRTLGSSYHRKQRAHRTAVNTVRVADMEEAKLDGRRIIASFHDVKRTNALIRRKEDQALLNEVETEKKIKQRKTVRQVRSRRDESFERRVLKEDERFFATDFNQGMVSVSNALHKHERLANKFLISTEKNQITELIKEELEFGQDRTRKNRSRNIAIKQLKGRNEKELLERSVYEAAEYRVAEAYDNVARQKAARAIHPKVYKHDLPIVTTFTGIDGSDFTGLCRVTPDEIQLFGRTARDLCKSDFSENPVDSLPTFNSYDPDQITSQKSKLTSIALV